MSIALMYAADSVVAPHAGAWIEMLRREKEKRKIPSRPTRARGLKSSRIYAQNASMLSRPTRARGLKLPDGQALGTLAGRAPRGRVD